MLSKSFLASKTIWGGAVLFVSSICESQGYHVTDLVAPFSGSLVNLVHASSNLLDAAVQVVSFVVLIKGRFNPEIQPVHVTPPQLPPPSAGGAIPVIRSPLLPLLCMGLSLPLLSACAPLIGLALAAAPSIFDVVKPLIQKAESPTAALTQAQTQLNYLQTIPVKAGQVPSAEQIAAALAYGAEHGITDAQYLALQKALIPAYQSAVVDAIATPAPQAAISHALADTQTRLVSELTTP